MVDVELKPLLSREQAIYKMVHRLERMRGLEELRGMLRSVREEVAGKGFTLMPWLKEVAGRLGVADSISGQLGPVGLATYLKG